MQPNLNQLDTRIKEATVKLRRASDGDTVGTGFFVLPHRLITCLHVLSSADGAVLLFHDDGRAINNKPLTLEHFEYDKANDIALITLPDALVQLAQPCLYLRDVGSRRDLCCAYGYGSKKKLDNGSFLSLKHGGTGSDKQRIAWHEVEDDRITGGFSGSALVNEATGCVIGVINTSFSKQSSEGGFATPTASILQAFPFLQQEQDQHKGDTFWQRSKTAIATPTLPSEQAIPKRRYIAGTFVEARAFQGRVKRLEKLTNYLIEQRNNALVQIHAPVGRGKSALAYHFVKQIEASHRDSFTGIVVMSLRKNTADSFEPSFFSLLRQVIPTEKVKPFDAILQQPEQEGSSKVMQIVQHILADERILVVLDNLEDALDESNHVRSQYRVVLEMLAHSLASQNVHFLLTSRRPLETDIVNLGGYSKKIKLDGLEDAESIALMHDLQEGDDFKLEAVDGLGNILNHDLQGLPLNIVTLASYLKTKEWTLPRYLSQPERLAELKDNASKVLYESRNAEEQRIMQVLAIFQQPVPLQALQYILPEIAELSELCDRLEQHLVVLVAKDELGIPSSYALRPVDGEYVLRQVEDAKALHKQAADYYLQHTNEIQDVLDAFNQLMQAEEYEQAAHTLKSVDDDLELRGESRRRLALWQQLEDKPLSQESKAKRLYHGLAVSTHQLGKVREAIAYYQQALTISREIGDRHGEGAHLGNLGIAYKDLGEVQQAIDYYQQVLTIAREIGNRRGEGAGLGNLGLAYANLGEIQQAIHYYQQALTIAQEIGDRRGEGTHLGNLGLAYADLGEVQQAIDYYQQALKIAQEIGNRRGEGNDLGNLGTAYYRLGEVQQAIDYYQEALTITQEIGDRHGEGNHLGNLGTAYRDLGKVEQAIDYHHQALNIAQEIGNRQSEGSHLGSLGNAYYSLGEVQQAIDYYQQALTIAREIGDRRGEGAHLGNLGNAYKDLGEVQQAIDYYQQALTIAREIGDRRGEGAHLGNLGNAYKDLGEVQQAIDYYQQALTIAQEIGDRRGQGNHLANLGVAAAIQQNMYAAIAMWFVALAIYMQVQAPTAQTVLQWLRQSSAKGTDVPAILRELFRENGAVGDRILKEATGIDYHFYRETPASEVKKVIALLEQTST